MRFRSFLQLKKQFAESPPPDPKDLHGYYEVRLVTGFLPPLRFFGHRKFFPVDAGNPEPGGGGFNEFTGRVRIGSFVVESADSILGDGQRVLRINYNRTGNPFWLRPLNDELKKVGEQSYLGRGIFRLFGLTFNSFYFSVEREHRSRFTGKRHPNEQTVVGTDEAIRTSEKTGSVIHGRAEAVFKKAADTIVPRGGVFEAGAADYDLVSRVNAYLDTLAPVIRRLTPPMLWYLECVSLLFNGRRFSRLSHTRAERFLERMEAGRLLYHRHMILFLKLLIMTAFYEQQIPAEAIGYVHGCHLQSEEGEAS